MNTATKIRAAYLRAHQYDLFSINIAGNVRPLLQDKQTTNHHLYSGEPVLAHGGAMLYWKFEDGYFVAIGSRQAVAALVDVVKTFEVYHIAIGEAEVLSMREHTAALKPAVPQLSDYEGYLTKAERILLENDLER